MNKNNEKFDIYEVVTNQIIEILETHKELSFTKTWFPASGEIFANNPVSGSVYQGLNQLLLCFLANKYRYTQNRWLTVNQSKNWNVYPRKGQHGCLVTYVSRMYKDEKTGRSVTKQVLEILESGGAVPQRVETIPYLKWYKVFNLDQFADGLPEKLFFRGETLSFSEPEKDLAAEEYLSLSGANIKYVPFAENLYTLVSGQQKANFYCPDTDVIQLTERSQFKETQGFYRTAFHELGHWTGHHSRLNRNLQVVFGSADYAKEELIAELFSAFTAANCGFASQITNNAAYINNWLKCLKDDKKFIFQASGKAQEATKFVSRLVASKIGQPVLMEQF